MNRISPRFAVVLLCAAMVLPAGLMNSAASAQDDSAATQKLISQLADDSFDTRRQAREKLFKLGRAAIPALSKTAQDRTKETSYSAVRILARIMNEAPTADSDAARKALETISKGDDAIARQARESLEENRRMPRRGAGTPNVPGRGLRGGGGGIRIQPGNGNVSSRQTTIINGVETTTVQEPGQRIQIRREPNGPVSITITPQGQKQQTYRANSLEELKRKHPDAFKVFEQHAGQPIQFPNFPEMRIPMGLIDGQGMRIDPFPGNGADPFAPFDRMQRQRRQQQQRQMDDARNARKIMQEMSVLLRSLKAKSRDPEVRQLETKLNELRKTMERVPVR